MLRPLLTSLLVTVIHILIASATDYAICTLYYKWQLIFKVICKEDHKKNIIERSEKKNQEVHQKGEVFNVAANEAVQLMRSKLLGCVQKCLVVSGYDTLDIIASMDDDCDQHRDHVEAFIQEVFLVMPCTATLIL